MLLVSYIVTPFQMVHAILGLLIPLCAILNFGARLHSSSLFARLCKLPMTLLTVSVSVLFIIHVTIYSFCIQQGLMLQLLKECNQCGDHSDCDNYCMPALVDNPIISSYNEEPSVCTATSGSLGRMAPPADASEEIPRQLPNKPSVM